MAENDKNQGKTPVPPGTEQAQRARTTEAPRVTGAPIRASTANVNERRMEMNDKLEEDKRRITEEAKQAQEKRKESEDEARKVAYAEPSPTNTVSAKENQPMATPVDTSAQPEEVSDRGGDRRFDATGMAIGEVDKQADLPFRDNWQPPAPTQDPPLNVGARVPAGSSRVDLTRRESGAVEAGEALIGQPGGHLGSPISAVPPAPLVMNPPVAPRGGATRASRE